MAPVQALHCQVMGMGREERFGHEMLFACKMMVIYYQNFNDHLDCATLTSLGLQNTRNIPHTEPSVAFCRPRS